MNIIRPHITLLVLCCVALACKLLMMVYPQQGIMIAGVKFRFSDTSAINDSIQERKIEDVEQFLAQLDTIAVAADTRMTDSVIQIIRKESIVSLQFKDGNSSSLFSLFEALDHSKETDERMHIFHYGDSQIESDRMSNVLRHKLQEKFGGHGPGLIAPVPITASANIVQSQSDNWKRYTSYGFDDGKASHSDYGVMCAFGRFTPAQKREDIVAMDSVDAWIEMRASGMSTVNCKIYNEAILYFGNFQYGFQLTLMQDEVVISEELIEPEAGVLSRKWTLPKKSGKLKFTFRGPDSPDVYGIELHGTGGVNLSNIALRGNDGGAFKRVNSFSMTPVFNELNAKLFILQFGGNAVPHLSSEQNAKSYGIAFRAHIRRFKHMMPEAAIIVVGPSDMSTSIDGAFQTWPYLESLRDGMKQAAFDEDCAFWDMFEVMGGKNSMVSWVTNNPPYAGPDYTHFTPAGARKVAELLYKAISTEYDAWKATQTMQ